MVLATHFFRQFPLHFPARASPCAITFQLDSTTSGSNDIISKFCQDILEKFASLGYLPPTLKFAYA